MSSFALDLIIEQPWADILEKSDSIHLLAQVSITVLLNDHRYINNSNKAFFAQLMLKLFNVEYYADTQKTAITIQYIN